MWQNAFYPRSNRVLPHLPQTRVLPGKRDHNTSPELVGAVREAAIRALLAGPGLLEELAHPQKNRLGHTRGVAMSVSGEKKCRVSGLRVQGAGHGPL